MHGDYSPHLHSLNPDYIALYDAVNSLQTFVFPVR